MVYTGGEREVPSERVTSEFCFGKDVDDGYEPPEVRNPSPGYDFSNADAGGIMPIEDTTRETVDTAAEDYDVSLRYDEGVVHIRGEREEIADFVDEICGSGQIMEGSNHPQPSITEGADLETGSQILPDGGSRYGMPIGGCPSYVQVSDPDDSEAGNLP